MKILITGENSYIGESFKNYCNNIENFDFTTLDMKDQDWVLHDFSVYDVVFHVAGIAHDTGKKKDAELYYKINRDLAIETAKKAKESGVKQFIFMSSILIYNGCKDTIITAETLPKTKGCYGDSKLQADLSIQKLQTEDFKISIIRPPMIFGPKCKGNFPRLFKLTSKTFIFPKIKNKRSMLYIDNLNELIKLIIINKRDGIFFPQNKEYFSTYFIVKTLANKLNKKIFFTRLFNILVYIFKFFMPSINKMFGNLVYDSTLSDHFNYDYCVVDNLTSINNYHM